MIKSMSNEKMWNVARLALAGVWVVVLYVMLKPPIRTSIDIFQDNMSDMTHGWLVAPGALLAAWTLRDKVRAAAGRPAWDELFLLLLVFALLWLGMRGSQSRFSQLALVLPASRDPARVGF